MLFDPLSTRVLGPDCDSAITGAIAVLVLFSAVTTVVKGQPMAPPPVSDGPQQTNSTSRAPESEATKVKEAHGCEQEVPTVGPDIAEDGVLLSPSASRRFRAGNALILGEALPGGTGEARLVCVSSDNDDNGKAVGVFKGRSSENDHANTIPKGTGYIREQAASLLDPDGYYRVPTTVQADLVRQGSIVDSGSLARFVPDATPSWEFGPSRFTESDVHRIAMFDVRTLNLDRNGGNMLLQGKSGNGALVPIDHGQILPERLDYVDLDWVFWPQSEKPFTPDELAHIRSLDVERDVTVLKERLKPAAQGDVLSDDALMSLAIGTAWLQTCAACGLSLRQIGEAMLRPSLSSPSRLELMVEAARAGTGVAADDGQVQAASEHRAAMMASLAAETIKWASAEGVADM